VSLRRIIDGAKGAGDTTEQVGKPRQILYLFGDARRTLRAYLRDALGLLRLCGWSLSTGTAARLARR
jgi:hypothetical protein